MFYLSVSEEIRDLNVLLLYCACRCLGIELRRVHGRKTEAWHVKVHACAGEGLVFLAVPKTELDALFPNGDA